MPGAETYLVPDLGFTSILEARRGIKTGDRLVTCIKYPSGKQDGVMAVV